MVPELKFRYHLGINQLAAQFPGNEITAGKTLSILHLVSQPESATTFYVTASPEKGGDLRGHYSGNHALVVSFVSARSVTPSASTIACATALAPSSPFRNVAQHGGSNAAETQVKHLLLLRHGRPVFTSSSQPAYSLRRASPARRSGCLVRTGSPCAPASPRPQSHIPSPACL